jgi:outer membrane protein OmpA-like peptidoglycan-associated protein
MGRTQVYRLMAVAAMGLAFSFNGCQCSASAKAGSPPQTATATPPPPPAPEPPAPPPAPPPPAKPKLVAVGNATLQGNRVMIPGELEFDLDKATIKPTKGNEDILNTLNEFLKQNANVTKMRIEGHTDNTGKADHNDKLSQERADAVAKWLSDKGVDKNRLISKGFGASRPLVANDTEEHKHQNRRCEFHVAELNGAPPDAAPATGTAAAGGAGTTSTTAAATPPAPTAPATPKK